jgi:tRNA nucleotidyltransferase/poly(A) polymerase
MKKFQEWLKESSYRTATDYPQDSVEHPEGSVRRHSMMVRHSLDAAIDLIKQKQQQDPEGPLSNLDLNFSPDEYNILRLAGNLHDIGKGSSMSEKITKDGRLKIQNIGHDQPEHFEKGMGELGTAWHQMYSKADAQDKEDLWWLIKHHMSLDDARGIENKALKREILDDQGKYKSDRRIKLLLVLLLMDRMGRGGTPTSWQLAKQFAQSNVEPAQQGIQGLYSTSDTHKQNLERIASRASKPSSDNPQEFVAVLKQKGRTSGEIRAALSGKFKDLSSETINSLLGESRLSFRAFFESEDDEPATMKANIPLGEFQAGAELISNNFKKEGYTIYVAGGTVRDYLMNKFHDEPFEIKDVDFATNANPDDIQRVLDNMGVKSIPTGKSFGVIVAVINKIEYEIATFREESGYSDKRRPDIIKPSDAKNDYRRRDFTMNALFYDMPEESGGLGTIIDFGKGRGFEAIKQKKVQTVGMADDRFGEDPLRVLRGVRFYGMFNKENLKDRLDPETFEAMKKFGNLEGVSPERIQAEFIAALLKARDPRVVLHGFDSIGALPYMFPNLTLDMDAVDHLANLPNSPDMSNLSTQEKKQAKKRHGDKKIILILATLLRKAGTPQEIRNKLNKLKWPNDTVDEVASLIQTWLITQNPTPQNMSQHAMSLSKKNGGFRRELLSNFHPMVGHEVDSDHLSHLGTYEPPTFSGEDIQRDLGLAKPGPEVGKEIQRRSADHYADSLRKWKNNPPMEQ